jgi:hypothetical protein
MEYFVFAGLGFVSFSCTCRLQARGSRSQRYFPIAAAPRRLWDASGVF